MSALFPRRLCAAFAALVAFGHGASVHAQSAPAEIAPLQLATDQNNVNIHDGRTTIEMPVLSVPAAPNLRFDSLQNAAPFLNGKRLTASGAEQVQRSYSVHIGAATSDAFDCVESDCLSVNGTGSTFNPNMRIYTERGSATVWNFGLSALNDTSAYPSYNYYATAATYPNGEVINYYYDALLAGLPFNRKMVRPTRITSTLGYVIKITYADNSDPLSAGWGRVTEAAIYAAADENTPLRRLVYSGSTITEYGQADTTGRTYDCQGCVNAIGASPELASGSMQLPGEGTLSLQIGQAAVASGNPVVASVTRDGATWNYAYQNLRLQQGTLRNIFDRITVTAPDGSSRFYNIANSYHSVHDLATNRIHTTITSSTDELGRTTSFFYDGQDRPYRVVYPELNEVSVVHDEYRNIISRTTTPKPGSGLSPVTETANYDISTCPAVPATTPLCWRPTWTRDALNRQTSYSYNTRGQVTEQIDPADANGVSRRTSTIYDETYGISRPIEVRVCADTGTTCSSSAPIRTAYDFPPIPTLLPSAERRIDVAQGLTLTTTYTYDASGRVLSTDSTSDGNAADASYVRYDRLGRKEWEIGAAAPSGARLATHYFYRDSDDKPTRIERGTVPNATDTVLNLSPTTQTAFAYDARRNAIREVLYSGATAYNVTDHSYDLGGRLECEARRMNPAIFPWNGSGGSLPSSACDLGTQGTGANDHGPDRITHNIYDATGRLTQIQRAYGTSQQQNYATYSFSPNGRQTSVTDANGNRAEMTWDGFDRQRRWIFPHSGPSSPNQCGSAGQANPCDYEEYGYDAVGNRTSFRKRDGSTFTYQYDNLNRMTVKFVPERSGLDPSFTRDVYYAYDLRNSVTEARFDSLSGDGVSNTYDAFGRQTSSRNRNGTFDRTLTYGYDAGSRRNSITYPGDVVDPTTRTFTYGYDARSRLNVVLDPGNGWLDGFSYSDRGPVTDQSYAGGPGGWSNYTYDSVDRAMNIVHAMGGSGSVTYGFAYNPASQITTRTRNNNAYAWNGAYNVSRNYSVNGLNQYTAAGAVSLTYDGNGNLTGDGTRTYTYDVENRLVLTSTGATLRYDPLGRLWTSSAPGFETIRYLYDGDALVSEYDASGNLLARHVHGADAGADDPLVWYGGNSVAQSNARYLRRDHQGTIVTVTDSGGAPLAINTYDEWGIPGANNQGRFQYTGQSWMGELGMYYYKARIYSPTLGRFLQTDPVGYQDQVNLYSYVGNDPVNAVDPDGQACIGANGLSDYCRRAELYRRFDMRFSGQTRFFGAASMTVTMLANNAIPILSAQLVSSDTRNFLTRVSGRLEQLNVNVARGLESGRISGSNLDQRIVHAEQTVVQGELNSLRQNDAATYNRVVGETNALLNPRGLIAGMANTYPSDRAYQRVLNGVRESLGRDIDFSKQSDREAIGNALIASLRGRTCGRIESRIPTPC